MTSTSIPLIILGGGDSRPVELPDAGSDQHALSGYKALDIRIAGRPLILHLIDQLEESGCFSPVYVAGPTDVYAAQLGNTPIIDTDGSFGQNIKSSLEHLRVAHPGLPVAYLTSDVLPKAESFQGIMAQYHECAPCDMFFPLVRTSERSLEDSSSAWKPVYRVTPTGETDPVTILGGHLVVVDPEALRRELVYAIFQAAYATRNRPVAHRRNVMLRRLISQLLIQDALHILGLRVPTLSWDIVGAGFRAANRLRRGTITQAQLEHAIRTILVTRRHRKRHPDRRVHVPVTDATGLAMDIDTVEEAEAIGGTVDATRL